jgi:hypothetical protein
MNANISTDPVTFGRYLSSFRIKKEIDLEDISEDIKVGTDILSFIEDEDHSRLPAEIYVKGFVLAYADAVGADKNKVVKMHKESLDVYISNLESQKRKTSKKINFFKKSPKILAILVFMAAFFVIVAFKSRNSFIEKSGISSSIASEGNVNVKRSQFGLDTYDDSRVVIYPSILQLVIENSVDDKTKKMLLYINAVDETWIKIIVDNQHTKEYNIHSGDYIELEANKNFNIAIANKNAVKIKLNGNELILHDNKKYVGDRYSM